MLTSSRRSPVFIHPGTGYESCLPRTAYGSRLYTPKRNPQPHPVASGATHPGRWKISWTGQFRVQGFGLRGRDLLARRTQVGGKLVGQAEETRVSPLKTRLRVPPLHTQPQPSIHPTDSRATHPGRQHTQVGYRVQGFGLRASGVLAHCTQVGGKPVGQAEEAPRLRVLPRDDRPHLIRAALSLVISVINRALISQISCIKRSH